MGLALGNLLFIPAATFPFVDCRDGKVHDELVGSLHNGMIKKVVGVQRLFSRPTLLRVQLHELGNQVNSVVRHPLGVGKVSLECLLEAIRHARLIWTRLKLLPQAACLVNVRPVFRCGMSNRTKDEIQLRRLVCSLEKARATEHFCHDTTDTPHVDLCRVLETSEQELRRTIPQRNDLVGQALHFRVPATSQSQIGNLQFALIVYQQVGRLEIPMDHLVCVHIMDAAEQLVGPRLDMILGEFDLLSLKNTGKIILEVLKDHEDILGDFTLVCVEQNAPTAICERRIVSKELKSHQTTKIQYDENDNQSVKKNVAESFTRTSTNRTIRG